MEILGIDVGGSGIKGAMVDTKTGTMVTERIRIETPQPASPSAVIETMKTLVNEFDYKGPLGVGFPAIVLDGVVMSAANIDNAWIGHPGQATMAEATGCEVFLVNDADAAGVAEMRFGAGHEQKRCCHDLYSRNWYWQRLVYRRPFSTEYRAGTCLFT